jgi:hypothetical protein
MFVYEDDLRAFFRVNEIVDGELYVQKLGIVRTEDLVYCTDHGLRSKKLSPDQFLQLWTAMIFVKLHKQGWKFKAVMTLLKQYRDELQSIRHPDTYHTVRGILAGLGVAPGLKAPERFTDVSKCQLVLDSLRSMMQQLMIYRHERPPAPAAAHPLDSRPASRLPHLLARLKNV